MSKDKCQDLYAGLFILVIGAVMLIASFSVPAGASATIGIGSDFMPKVTCGLMTALGLIITGNGIRDARTYEEAEKTEKISYKELVLTILSLVIYMALLVPVGFVIMTTLYVAAQATILAPEGHKKTARHLLIGAVAAVAIYWIFRNVFVLMLPAGILGF